MKLSSLFFLTLCISFFSEANSVPLGNQTFIEASQVRSWNHIGEKEGVYVGLNQLHFKIKLSPESIINSDIETFSEKNTLTLVIFISPH